MRVLSRSYIWHDEFLRELDIFKVFCQKLEKEDKNQCDNETNCLRFNFDSIPLNQFDASVIYKKFLQKQFNCSGPAHYLCTKGAGVQRFIFISRTRTSMTLI